MPAIVKKLFALALVLGALAGASAVVSQPASAISCRPAGGFFLRARPGGLLSG